MNKKAQDETYSFENQEWIESLDFIIENEPPERVKEIIDLLYSRAQEKGIEMTYLANTPYINSVPVRDEVPYPGNREIERRIKSIIRWNAMAMVVRANKEEDGIGGHISSYASSATLYEVGFNHFFRGGENKDGPDVIYYQGHASPGIYSRAFLEGRFDTKHLDNFRRELKKDGGLSSYPHPRLMKDFWQFPTVSMGLGPIMAIYQARFNRYLEDKGLKKASEQKVWAFLGDGEMDEPESMGALTLASREELDNLIFVVNCNLQRLDGPVRGNGSIVQELEAAFKGAGWKVIKVMLSQNWDPLFEKDKNGLLMQRLGEIVDGQRQRYSISDGAYIREHFFGKYPELKEMVKHYSDEQLEKLGRGGHDPLKVYNAYRAAANHKGSPVVILAQTVKGYGLGEAGEGRNVTHQQKKLNEEELRYFRSRFNIPISDKDLAKAPFYKLSEDSEEMQYLRERRKQLGGYIPVRKYADNKITMPDNKLFDEFMKGSGDRDIATTMAVVQLLTKLLKDKNLGKLIVPIVPDESRTFGMDSLFRQVGIYAHKGQLYEPVDKESLLYYKEAKDGAILEEGITEAGSMSSFIAAGTAYSTHGINTIPFYIFYSMFGFQRTGDSIWAAADARTKGFMIGGTSGRTTLAGEGLQHQDGQSHLYALSVPGLRAYDPTYAYELAVILKDGLKRMYVDGEEIFYYITVMNEKYQMPEMPKGVEEGIINGMYPIHNVKKTKVNLLGSGSILNEVRKAAEVLKHNYKIESNIWSITSYKQLYDDVIETDRVNRLQNKNEKSYIEECFPEKQDLFVAAHDYVKALPLSLSKWFPGSFVALGTDGFGKSEGRTTLRDHFEVDAKHIVLATLSELAKLGKIDASVPKKAVQELNIDPKKISPTSF
ncbi:MAG: pyruvate dehydrogenase (acetyl-transferring), homodimeric type [Bacteroidetes bacterium]|jgi:pyruvate dehydrogenase E1 component|nr:pyruvate dehydrogenase (acetyl-transferring), homodimeric type [Bacteroidota bacterium]